MVKSILKKPSALLERRKEQSKTVRFEALNHSQEPCILSSGSFGFHRCPASPKNSKKRPSAWAILTGSAKKPHKRPRLNSPAVPTAPAPTLRVPPGGGGRRGGGGGAPSVGGGGGGGGGGGAHARRRASARALRCVTAARGLGMMSPSSLGQVAAKNGGAVSRISPLPDGERASTSRGHLQEGKKKYQEALKTSSQNGKPLHVSPGGGVTEAPHQQAGWTSLQFSSPLSLSEERASTNNEKRGAEPRTAYGLVIDYTPSAADLPADKLEKGKTEKDDDVPTPLVAVADGPTPAVVATQSLAPLEYRFVAAGQATPGDGSRKMVACTKGDTKKDSPLMISEVPHTIIATSKGVKQQKVESRGPANSKRPDTEQQTCSISLENKSKYETNSAHASSNHAGTFVSCSGRPNGESQGSSMAQEFVEKVFPLGSPQRDEELVDDPPLAEQCFDTLFSENCSIVADDEKACCNKTEDPNEVIPCLSLSGSPAPTVAGQEACGFAQQDSTLSLSLASSVITSHFGCEEKLTLKLVVTPSTIEMVNATKGAVNNTAETTTIKQNTEKQKNKKHSTMAQVSEDQQQVSSAALNPTEEENIVPGSYVFVASPDDCDDTLLWIGKVCKSGGRNGLLQVRWLEPRAATRMRRRQGGAPPAGQQEEEEGEGRSSTAPGAAAGRGGALRRGGGGAHGGAAPPGAKGHPAAAAEETGPGRLLLAALSSGGGPAAGAAAAGGAAAAAAAFALPGGLVAQVRRGRALERATAAYLRRDFDLAAAQQRVHPGRVVLCGGPGAGAAAGGGGGGGGGGLRVGAAAWGALAARGALAAAYYYDEEEGEG